MDLSVVRGSVAVGVDGSEESWRALEWAVGHATAEGRALSVVHACGLAGPGTGSEDLGRAVAREAVERVRASASTLGVRSVVTMGSPVSVLLEASEVADLLVVGARGRGSVSRALLGSVSAAAARQAQCPVVVVRAPSASAEGPLPVVVGVDGTPVSTSAVELGFAIASLQRAPLTLVHATGDVPESAARAGRSYTDKVNLSADQERLVAETVTGLSEKYPDVPVTETYLQGPPVRRLVEVSRSAGLVVVGARGRRHGPVPLQHPPVRSVSGDVVERAACPVAVVRP
jgi:nucleotide-binding universal stress UspA family protein